MAPRPVGGSSANRRRVTLGVEAHNDTALGLYRSVGMEVEREWRVYAMAA